jgi:hypothetical protein
VEPVLLPEDVRWIKMSHFHSFVEDSKMNRYFLSAGGVVLCFCHEKLPKLSKYRFTYSAGDEVTYSVGQCPKCRTVFWAVG